LIHVGIVVDVSVIVVVDELVSGGLAKDQKHRQDDYATQGRFARTARRGAIRRAQFRGGPARTVPLSLVEVSSEEFGALMETSRCFPLVLGNFARQ
jgi:hypothetical protein